MDRKGVWFFMARLGLAMGRRDSLVGIVTRLPIGQPRKRGAMSILQTRYVIRHRRVQRRPTDRTLNIVVCTRQPVHPVTGHEYPEVE